MTELKAIIEQISSRDHANIQIQQVQKIPDNDGKENFKEELLELKQLMNKIVEKDKESEKKLQDVEQRSNKYSVDINNMKTSIHKMASKDEISSITQILPNLTTKEDLEMLSEKLKDKVDLNDTNEFKIQIANLSENQKMYLPLHK